MVGYSFPQRFAASILAGTKRQTVRSPRTHAKRHAVAGDVVHLYTGMRTRSYRLLGTARCISVVPIEVDTWMPMIAYADQRLLAADALDAFAALDGFADWPAMRDFWLAMHGGGAWSGLLIRWSDLHITGGRGDSERNCE